MMSRSMPPILMPSTPSFLSACTRARASAGVRMLPRSKNGIDEHARRHDLAALLTGRAVATLSDSLSAPTSRTVVMPLASQIL